MEDRIFKIKNIEFHLKQVSYAYDKCVSKAVRSFLDSDIEFNTVFKPCEEIKLNLNNLMKTYEELNQVDSASFGINNGINVSNGI